MKKRILVSLVLLLLVGMALAGCNQGRALTGDEQTEVLSYTEPIADGMFSGLNANNYAEFSKDFGETMLVGLDEAAFADTKAMLDSKLGAYQSREVNGVAEIQENILVIYKAVFETAPEVTIRLSISTAEPHQVTGLWFDSPELRK